MTDMRLLKLLNSRVVRPACRPDLFCRRWRLTNRATLKTDTFGRARSISLVRVIGVCAIRYRERLPQPTNDFFNRTRARRYCGKIVLYPGNLKVSENC